MYNVILQVNGILIMPIIGYAILEVNGRLLICQSQDTMYNVILEVNGRLLICQSQDK